MNHIVSIYDSTDPAVRRAKTLVYDLAPLSWVLLFEGVRRRGIALGLVKAAAEEALRRYGAQASIQGVSIAGLALTQAAQREGIALTVISAGAAGELP